MFYDGRQSNSGKISQLKLHRRDDCEGWQGETRVHLKEKRPLKKMNSLLCRTLSTSVDFDWNRSTLAERRSNYKASLVQALARVPEQTLFKFQLSPFN